jgi:trimethylamine:corrinoid methyltransferase-like protein
MYTGQIWRLHDDAALKRIDDAGRRLLIKTGRRIQHEGLLARLEGAGCRIDAPAMRCTFTEKVIDAALAHLGGRRDETVEAAVTYVDCKRPGLEAVFPKMFPLVASPFGTALRVRATGLLSAGQDYSPVQHLLDADIMEATERFAGGFEIDDETLDLELIERTMRDGTVNFVDKEHTLAHFRTEQWHPRWFDRTLWQGEGRERASEASMLERMDGRVRAAIARYERPAIDATKIGELKAILAAFERRLDA